VSAHRLPEAAPPDATSTGAGRTVTVTTATRSGDGLHATATTTETWFQPSIQRTGDTERQVPPEELIPHPIETKVDQEDQVDGRG
jgi:hypothetical protein